MEFLTEYGMFLAKFTTVVLISAVFIVLMIALVMRTRSEMSEHLEVKHLNEKFKQMRDLMNMSLLDKKQLKSLVKIEKKKDKQKKKETNKKRIFILRFHGDIQASDAASLADEISAILGVANEDDEVCLILESGGGIVHDYGYAASQLSRIRNADIRLTIAVDKVAASGGYMMACVADHIIAAPFAIVGSIGVLAQIPNFNRLLKKHNIDFEQISAGEYKRTLTLFGENTDQDRDKMKQDLEQIHELFKSFIKEYRPGIDLEKVSTGEHWYGKQALELNLVDELITSDDWLCKAVEDKDLYEIRYVRKKSFPEKMRSSMSLLFSSLQESGRFNNPFSS